MVVGAEMALEGFGTPVRTRREILLNLEINNRCGFTSRCGDNCYLNAIGKGRRFKSLDPNIVREMAREAIWAGEGVRHVGIVGKEPLESRALLLEILHEYHNAPRAIRPAKLGLITAAARRLDEFAGQFEELPLDWLAISLDVASSGLRLPQNSEPLLESALKVRRLRGVKLVGVNTVFKDENWQECLKIGHKAKQVGVDQWTVGPHLMPLRGLMVPRVSADTVRRLADAVVQQFSGSGIDVAVELDFDQLHLVVGHDPALKRQAWRWRIEIPIGKNIRLIAKNPRRGFFLRVRHDGQMLDHNDFRRIGLCEGSYGRYAAGKLALQLNQLATNITLKHEASQYA